MRRRTAVWFALALIALASCESKVERPAPSTNPEVTVAVLTRFEGVTLYRVTADGKTIYVARTGAPTGEALTTSTHWEECHECGCSDRELTVAGVR